jgi:radical SAM superfamily enzyme YgiQ (UPF0313 family)
MNALFIYPEIPDTFWSFKFALEFVSKKSAFPPLGLLTVASMVPKAWHKRLVDMNVKSLTEEDLLWADYVFISAMHIQKASVQHVVKLCRAYGVKVVAGGPYFTTAPDDFSMIDHVVLGEAETVFPLFIEDIQKGCAVHEYSSREKPDLSLTPLPAWDLIDFNDYDSMLVQFSRGCPYDCEFCDIVQLNGRKQRTKTPARFLQEMDALYHQGWRGSIFIVDDNFIGSRSQAKTMLRELIGWMERRRRPFCFFTEASVNLAEEVELMDLMSHAGFYKVFIGIETPSTHSLEEAGKVQNMKRNLLESVRIIQSHGFEVMGGFIIGFDHDPEDIFDRQIEFIQSSGITIAMVGLLEALNGTRLWRRLKEEGRILWEATGNNTDGMLNYVPRMDRDSLIRGYHRVLETIYAPAAYYRRCIDSLKSCDLRGVSRIGLEEIKALFRSIWRIGIKNEAGFRKYYWRLLLKILFLKPRSFGDAVRAMIMGLHLRRALLIHMQGQ